MPTRDQSDLLKEISDNLVKNDLSFGLRFLVGIKKHKESLTGAESLSICLYNYLCLITHESFRYFEKSIPEIDSGSRSAAHDIIERSRHSVKLFDDTARRLQGVADCFGDEIIPHHRDYCGGTAPGWLRRICAPDLSLVRYGGALVSTSHVANFHLGLTPQELLLTTEVGSSILPISTYLGRYFSGAHDSPSAVGSSFLDEVNFQDFQSKDVHSKKVYQRAFDPSFPEGLSAALTAFQCSVNFLDILLKLDKESASQGPLFKSRFVVLYHALTGLAKVQKTFSSTLTCTSNNYLSEILTSPATKMIFSSGAKKLRNTLVHYGVQRATDSSVLQLGCDPLDGLVGAFLPDHDFYSLSRALVKHVSEVAHSLNGWSGI